MLVKLLPEQIARNWKLIRMSVEESLPPVSYGAEDRTDRILMKLLTGSMLCWVGYNEDMSEIRGIITTIETGDPGLGVKNLMIYTFYGLEFNPKDFAEGLLVIYRYAKARDCSRIVAYSDDEKILRLVKRLNGETRYTFISIPIK